METCGWLLELQKVHNKAVKCSTFAPCVAVKSLGAQSKPELDTIESLT